MQGLKLLIIFFYLTSYSHAQWFNGPSTHLGALYSQNHTETVYTAFTADIMWDEQYNEVKIEFPQQPTLLQFPVHSNPAFSPPGIGIYQSNGISEFEIISKIEESKVNTRAVFKGNGSVSISGPNLQEKILGYDSYISGTVLDVKLTNEYARYEIKDKKNELFVVKVSFLNRQHLGIQKNLSLSRQWENKCLNTLNEKTRLK
jgi:hypothetical protein